MSVFEPIPRLTAWKTDTGLPGWTRFYADQAISFVKRVRDGYEWAVYLNGRVISGPVRRSREHAKASADAMLISHGWSL